MRFLRCGEPFVVFMSCRDDEVVFECFACLCPKRTGKGVFEHACLLTRKGLEMCKK